MEKLAVSYLKVNNHSSVEVISSLLDLQDRHPIKVAPWPSFPYKPDVSFSIAHHDDCIFLKYYISERSIRALHRKTNDPVFQDSCVEFFISFNGDDEYYNLEFNCIGTCLLGFGKGKTARTLVGEEHVQLMRRHSVIKTWSENGITQNHWELTLVIPQEVFVFHQIQSLRDLYCRVNFFKCGDESPEPHFLAWKNVASTSPNFHLPEFFGTMQFICG